MFRIGQKVVCIDDSIPPDKLETGHDGHRWKMVGSLNGLKAGTVYTIRGAGRCFVNLKPVVFLEEIQRGIVTKNGSGECMGEPGFRMSRFRPLIEKKTETGMAILREILDRETITDKPPVRAALSTR